MAVMEHRTLASPSGTILYHSNYLDTAHFSKFQNPSQNSRNRVPQLEHTLCLSNTPTFQHRTSISLLQNSGDPLQILSHATTTKISTTNFLFEIDTNSMLKDQQDLQTCPCNEHLSFHSSLTPLLLSVSPLFLNFYIHGVGLSRCFWTWLLLFSCRLKTATHLKVPLRQYFLKRSPSRCIVLETEESFKSGLRSLGLPAFEVEHAG